MGSLNKKFCGIVEQCSEQVGSDPSSAIDQVASEGDQLAVGAFNDLVLLSAEMVLTVGY